MTQREQYKPAEYGIAIPKAIEQIHIRRSEYNDTVYVAMKSGLWEAKFNTPEGNLHQRIYEITAEMERKQ